MGADQDQTGLFAFHASPFFWANKAHSLLHAAELLWPDSAALAEHVGSDLPSKSCRYQYGPIDRDFEFHPFTFPIWMALMGFSIECLLKGLIIKGHPEYVSNGKLAKQLQTHDLRKLARICQLRLSKHERIYFEQVIPMMIDEYRYPIGKEQPQTVPALQLGGHARDVALGLFDRLYPLIAQEAHASVHRKRSPRSSTK